MIHKHKKAASTKSARETNAIKGKLFRNRIFNSDGTPAHTHFHMHIRQRVNSAIPSLQAGVDYVLSEICGEDFWMSLDTSERIKAGMYMAYMIREREFPLVNGKPVGVTKTYRLK